MYMVFIQAIQALRLLQRSPATDLCVVALCFMFNSNPVLAHQGKKHFTNSAHAGTAAASKKALAQIADVYNRDVRPLFENKCFDCHGNSSQLPWYSSLPGAKQLIDRDIKEAKEHLDMSKGYPFTGHGGINDDLDAIEQTIKEGSMPPLRYRALHWNSLPNAAERNIIQTWLDSAREILE